MATWSLLFLVVGVGFIFVHLLVGKMIRPSKPDAEKLTIYECGEPTIGSAWIQFDLRFYVVALLFVIFDVEVAFFFPWAVVFGKANAAGHDEARRCRNGARRQVGQAARTEPGPMRVPRLADNRCSGTEARSNRIIAEQTRRRRSLALAGLLGHPGLLRRAAGRLRLPVEARRPRLGAQHARPEQAAATATAAMRSPTSSELRRRRRSVTVSVTLMFG